MTKKTKSSQKKSKTSKKSASKTKKSKEESSQESFQIPIDTPKNTSQPGGSLFWPIMSIVLAIALVAVIVLNLGSGGLDEPVETPGDEDTKFQDEFLFVESTACDEACAEMEPMAKEAAELADLEFRKIGLDEEIPVPGYMVIKGEEAKTLLEAIQDEDQFYKQMCQVTEVEEFCQKSQEESQEDTAEVDEGTVDMKEFNECLSDNGMTIYGMKSCPHCTNLVESLGGYDSAEPVYVECTENEKRCKDEMQGAGVPEIQLDGEVYSGERSPERLAEATGCSL
ncbi:MAG: hypothetical protein ACOCZQ_02085 [Nanoarchaeota archaeon]